MSAPVTPSQGAGSPYNNNVSHENVVKVEVADAYEAGRSGAGTAMDEDTPELQAHRHPASLSVPARSKLTSQLPTPQSPSNPAGLAQSLSLGADSPIRNGSRVQHPTPLHPAPQPLHAPHLGLERFGSTGSLMTPESSPIFARRPRSSHVASVSPPSTPRGHQSPDTPEHLSTVTPRPSIPMTPSPRPAERTPPSALSSPFMQAAQPRTPQRPRRASAHSPPPATVIDGRLSPSASSSKSPVDPAQEALRPAGGEILRLRQQAAADQAARLQETESRRPEYLRRAKRRLSDPDVDAPPVGNQENAAPALGVVDSPAKGRRITLFQETSEESFEQSLLAGGYPTYGHTPAYAEPTAPPAHGARALSQRAVDWITQATPGFRPASPVKPNDAERAPSEEEVRKRRRLEAFRDHNPAHSLFPVYVEGRGRVLLDRPPEDAAMYETPKKRNRRKKPGVLDSPSRRRTHYVEPAAEHALPVRPNWLDQVFPWSVRVQERAEMSRMEEDEKLKRIERYLERESDEDEEEDQSLNLPATDKEEPRIRRGRGKWVPLPVKKNTPRTPVKPERVYYPSDPADARAALLSKRSVRALAFRRKQEEEEDVVCPMCRGGDDGQELVQCDDCHRWFHAACIGVEDLAQLGREEDPWYCRDCLGLPPTGSSSPVYVPTDDRPLAGPRRDPLFFQGAGVQESPPGMPWGTHTLRAPKTPVRGARELPQFLSSRSSWAESSDVGPITPSTAAKSVRVYREPSAYDPLDEPFDPTATPSRGMRFSGPFTTPKATHLWPGRPSAPFQTPSRPSAAAARRAHGSAALPYALQFPDEYDDSPVRHAQPTIRVPKNAGESPLASRSTSHAHLSRPASPLARVSSGGSRGRA
ncbi:PHD-type domain-containing protein [Phanerochaete sordida]|uniref:PHD-type domain-containing protein n=1 Tax=Phanerochaete sordida TaxID=48140 RepID=A0A9P3GGA8_9APHY|nr:PHD-type domain-containing protein [Phanerochaete sordida]